MDQPKADAHPPDTRVCSEHPLFEKLVRQVHVLVHETPLGSFTREEAEALALVQIALAGWKTDDEDTVVPGLRAPIALAALAAAEREYLVASGWVATNGGHGWKDPLDSHRCHLSRVAANKQRQRDAASMQLRRSR